MNKRDAQLIYNLVEGTIFKIRDCAHKEQFILHSKEIDTIYAQVLNLLEQKRLRAEAFLDRIKE